MYETFYHHGIKGQKWGIRRYQNPDGSLTEEGKKRYYTDDGGYTFRGMLNRKALREQYGETKKQKISGDVQEIITGWTIGAIAISAPLLISGGKAAVNSYKNSPYSTSTRRHSANGKAIIEGTFVDVTNGRPGESSTSLVPLGGALVRR